MIEALHHSLVGIGLVTLLELAVIARILLRPHRDPASRIAWVVVVGVLPLLGMFAYLLLGEVNIGRRRVARLHTVLGRMPPFPRLSVGNAADPAAAIPEDYRHLFRLGRSISGFDPVSGNSARLMRDSNAAIDEMVADIDAAVDHVHLLFYIWLPDRNGLRIVEALKRATARGVTCRVMADDLGSRTIIRSEHWPAMRVAGVRVAAGLPIGNPFLRPFHGRIDLRNHRKIVVIDDRITYCGSQNCADPEFVVKAKYAPWVDAVMRFEGPIARQNQFLFASDWMTYVDEDLDDILRKPVPLPMPGGVTAQVVGTGPTVRYSAMPEMFETLLFAARREVIITTPYYVPDDSLQNALCTTAYRGVDTTIVFPARNDSLDRRRGQPQLLRGPARRRRQDLRVRGRPAAHQVADAGRRGHADRLGQHGPSQLRAQLREQHPVPRSRAHRCDARAPAGIHRAVASGHEGGGGGLADVDAGYGTTSLRRSGPCSELARATSGSADGAMA